MLLRTPYAFLLITLCICLSSATLTGQQELEEEEKKGFPYYHSHKGFTFTTPDNNFELRIASRLQFRFAAPGDQDPLTFDDFDEEKRRIFKINRARLKIGGHAYRPWLKYYWEYELGQGNLLDFRIMIEKWPWLKFKAGQWKTDYSRERVISSGEQQMVERSIINRPFTLDRQQGIAFYGHLAGKGAANFHYWYSLLNGMGRGARTNDDNHLMHQARIQWNPLGRVVEMSGSDLAISERPALLIAIGAADNISPYTRFSQSGGGELEGFDEGQNGQYKVEQLLLETVFKYKGISWQHETHFKRIDDRVNDQITELRGSYFQAGFFPGVFLAWAPDKLELALLYATYRPNIEILTNKQHQYSAAVNYFFHGHKNKLTAEFSYLRFEAEAMEDAEGFRFRLQWDISL